MTMTFALLLAALAAAPADAAASGQPQEQKKDRLICKRDDATESRLGSKRICKTAAQWRGEKSNDDRPSHRPMSEGL